MIKAVVLDIYGTLLEVQRPADPPEAAWECACVRLIGRVPCPLDEFEARADALVQREHELRKEQGEMYPEVDWRIIMKKAFPSLKLSASTWEALSHEWAAAKRRCVLARGGADLLKACRGNVFIGICSNAQAYTKHELDAALREAGLGGEEWFDPDFQFWSYEHGFAKPSPKAFELLTARMQARGVISSEILMVGDRADNDILPAKAQGWETFLVTDCCLAGALEFICARMSG